MAHVLKGKEITAAGFVQESLNFVLTNSLCLTMFLLEVSIFDF